MNTLFKYRPLFKLGSIVGTPGAIQFMNMNSIHSADLLSRHVTGDFGDLCDEDKNENRRAIFRGNRILSSYSFPAGKVWVITEADRSVTTLLLPEEY